MKPPGISLIGLAARLVPWTARAAWQREWEAETAYAWRRMTAHGRPPILGRIRLWLRVLTCVIDALLVKRETMTMSGLISDIRYAFRGLMRSPEFTVVAVLTLALGIAANTAVFTLVDRVLLRPLPFTEPDRLVSLRHTAREGQDELPMSSGLYRMYRDRSATLASVSLFAGTAMNVVTDGRSERIQGQAVTHDFFRVLGASAAHGRTFVAEEGAPGGAPVVILSDGLWRANFGADPDVVGRTVDMNGVLREVVGIMPADFGYPDRTARFWTPMVIDDANAPLAAFFASGVARIGPASSLEAVRAELRAMTDRLDEIYPEDPGAAFLMNVNLSAVARPLKEELVGDVSTTLWVLLGTVGVVLMIACANVANLLLVRVEGRRRELALRVAVGADRLHVLRAFLGESLVLCLSGGALGLALAAVAVRVTSRIIPTDLPRMAEVGIDLRILLFTGAVSIACATFFGLLPLLRYGAHDLAGELRDGGGRGSTGARQHHRLRNTLVVTQVALALVLLVGSGLMLRSLLALRAVDPGFQPAGAVTARVIVPPGEIGDPVEADRFFQLLRERVIAQPAVLAAGMVSSVPLGNSGQTRGGVGVEDHPRGPGELPIFATIVQASVGYVEAMRIRLLEGRSFAPQDVGVAGRGALVSESFARRWWPESSALGRGVRYSGGGGDWYRIIGVVDDVHETSLEQEPLETIYFPTLVDVAGTLVPARGLDLVIRTAGDPMTFVPILQRELASLNPRVPLANPQLMATVFDGATARTSFTMAMLGAASGIALLLGLVGIYGVVSYIVCQRTREIGLRMALGASGSAVRGMVVRQGLALAGVGVTVGLVAALGTTRIMGSLLYGVSAIDPVTYATVAASLIVVAGLASWIPALRAAAVNPNRALRAE